MRQTIREYRDLRDFLNGIADSYADTAAFLYKTKLNKKFVPVSYKDFRKYAVALGTALMADGKAGQKIAVIGENRVEWVLSYFAVAMGLGTVVPLDKELPPQEIAALIRRADVSTIIYTNKTAKRVKEAVEALEEAPDLILMDTNEDPEVKTVPTLIWKGINLIDDGDSSYSQLPIDPDAMCSLLFTSGTTGLAKGVMLSHTNICYNVSAVDEILDFPQVMDHMLGLSILPMHHTFEFTADILVPLSQGGTIAICEGLKYITSNMQEVKPTYIEGVPLIFENIHQRIWKQAEKSGKADTMKKAIKMVQVISRLDRKIQKKAGKIFKEVQEAFGGNLQLMVSGGAAISPEVVADFNAMGITMVQGYGMTETSPIISCNPFDNNIYKSAGIPIRGSEIRVEDPDSDGIGEIVVRNKSVMIGYYNDPEETAKVKTPDGWMHTGDYGYVDKKGYIYITGRKKNVIVTKNGKNIFPEEVEYYLCKSHFIKEAVVRGTEDGADLAVTAEIFPDQDALKEVYGVLTADQLNSIIQAEVDKANSLMSSYKRIKKFTLRDTEFAKTTTQKIKRW